eukprot:scaffold46791_cov14-Prasinocladus_malaysianus.AAC.1
MTARSAALRCLVQVCPPECSVNVTGGARRDLRVSPPSPSRSPRPAARLLSGALASTPPPIIGPPPRLKGCLHPTMAVRTGGSCSDTSIKRHPFTNNMTSRKLERALWRHFCSLRQPKLQQVRRASNMARLGTTKKVTLVFERFSEDQNNGRKQMRHLIVLIRKNIGVYASLMYEAASSQANI